MNDPYFASVGKQTDSIDVRLSFKIVKLFSEGLYASPNKAIEELVANAFDAGAQRVQLLLSPNLHDQTATIVIVDDGEGMDSRGLKQHWLIGTSNKRDLAKLPRGRQQIGKFGIGKLATYVLANRLSHISKRNGKYFATSMDFSVIDRRGETGVETKTPVKIPLRTLSENQAKKAVMPWLDSPDYKKAKMSLFGKGAPPSWTVVVMSSLKPKVHEIKPGFLRWVLQTALPLRPDFGIWLNGEKLRPSKQNKKLLKKWVLGKNLIQLPKPGPKDVSVSEDTSVENISESRFGLDVPGFGRISGYAEAYKDMLTGGKSDELGRSHGFFVYVFGRLVNVVDGHFGISPDELRHGTFGRFRLIVHMDSLDAELRSNREVISEGPLLESAQNVLRAIFNAVRPTLEKHDKDEKPGAKLARKLAASPASLSRYPIVALARAVVKGKSKSRYLIVPDHKKTADKIAFVAALEQRSAAADQFIAGLTVDYDGSPESGIAQYDTSTGYLRINAWHPFVATFHEEFTRKGSGQPLELLAMAEILIEAHLHSIGVTQREIDDFLTMRDQLLRNLANESGRKSALSIANELSHARNNPDELEEKVCAAFTSLGFDVTKIGRKGKPDGVAHAHLSADDKGKPRRYSVSLDAKSKLSDSGTISNARVHVSTIARHRDNHKCEHAVVIGRAFSTSLGKKSSVAAEIADDRKKTLELHKPKTITLITIDDLANLVKLRPIKQLGLFRLRELFNECQLPDESHKWVEKISRKKVKRPPYSKIIYAIHALQKEYDEAPVHYSGLRVKLSGTKSSMKYKKDEELAEICKGMAQMAPGSISASDQTVELDQSPENVIRAIELAMESYPKK